MLLLLVKYLNALTKKIAYNMLKISIFKSAGSHVAYVNGNREHTPLHRVKSVDSNEVKKNENVITVYFSQRRIVRQFFDQKDS